MVACVGTLVVYCENIGLPIKFSHFDTTTKFPVYIKTTRSASMSIEIFLEINFVTYILCCVLSTLILANEGTSTCSKFPNSL